jgi:LysM repeat protein
MKKEVQALIKRRRARFVPAILAGIAGLILIAIIVLIVAVITRGPALGLIQTATPTPSLTATARPTSTEAPATDTPADTPTATETPGPSPTPTQTVYLVEAGDSLFTIAEKFRANVCLIMAINDIGDPSVLAVGQSLIIPTGDEELPTATPLPTGLPRGARLQYVVQCGDTLDSIAAKFNSTGADIAKENKITDPLSIKIGDVLTVRVNIATPTPTATASNTPVGGGATGTPTPTNTP